MNVTPGESSPPLAGEKKKSRLSRMLHARKKSSGEATSFHDSAYASSENKLSDDVTPFENTGQIPGVAQDRNLVLDRGTGEIVDEDNGEVVTTVIRSRSVASTRY